MKDVLPQDKFLCWPKVSLLYFLLPIHTTCVLGTDHLTWRRGVMVFCFVQNFFFGYIIIYHHELEYYFFCCAKHKFFFQNLTLGYMTKTLNQIIFFFLHQNQNIFFSNIGNQNIFLEKNHNPPLQVKWSFPNKWYDKGLTNITLRHRLK